MQGATIVDGRMFNLVESGERRTRCVLVLNEQFLQGWSVRKYYCKIYGSYFNIEATPPLRMVFVCSVKTTIFAKGYSRSEVLSSGFEGCGVRKKSRPAGDWLVAMRSMRVRRIDLIIKGLTVVRLANTLARKCKSPLRCLL